MRTILLIFLIALLILLAAFAIVNGDAVQVDFPFTATRVEAPLFLVMIAFYLLGMFSGWTVLGFLGRSLRRVSHRDDDH